MKVSEIRKAVVAFLGSVVTLVGVFTGAEMEWANEELIGSLGAVLTTALTFLVPNEASDSAPAE